MALIHAEDEWLTTRWNRPDDQWPEAASPKPRTCSYCGGVHPDDVIPLLIAGWHVEPTTKNYKFYVNDPDGHSAVPPVKVYLQHWTQEQVQRADAILKARYEMERSHVKND
ncbi:hypothetical protein DPV79_15940 [Burkholderia reimsis]|uniref:Uncharacterized protein n=2 Tax=Burkholderia reimsis TaxID=2234132 RepID=A0A365QVK1_9BURK|nr:hypothetical protein DPV79_15940 [Burkholderia reimsis]